jgi:hypothetical protein
MEKWTLLGMAVGALFGCQASASEWVPIKWGDSTVREIDMSSITRNGSLVTFVARHTFADSKEYTVGSRGAKYLLISSRANCGPRTLAQLATEAYDENMALISKQQIQLPEDSPVTRDSIDESELNFICANEGQKAK